MPIRFTRRGCCARAATGQAAAPPRRLMNSRRRISAPNLRGQHCIGLNEYFDRGSNRHQSHCRSAQPISQLGHQETTPLIAARQAMTALLSKRTQSETGRCIVVVGRKVPLVDQVHRSNTSVRKSYSITSSARTSNVSGTSSPSVFAVCRLMANENLVGCNTGNSAGFAPLRMRPT